MPRQKLAVSHIKHIECIKTIALRQSSDFGSEIIPLLLPVSPRPLSRVNYIFPGPILLLLRVESNEVARIASNLPFVRSPVRAARETTTNFEPGNEIRSPSLLSLLTGPSNNHVTPWPPRPATTRSRRGNSRSGRNCGRNGR